MADGPRTVDELAADVGADPSALLRALRALACNGVFTEGADGRFGLTPRAELLREDHPWSVRGLLPMMPAELYGWADFHETMRTGEPAFPRVHGRSFFEHLAEHPEDRARYDAGQRAMGRVETRAALRAYPWQDLKHVVDIGGGTGDFLAGLLGAHPHLSGTLVDLPSAVGGASDVLGQAAVADRVQIAALDATAEPLPDGADAYVLKRVLCGWNVAEAKTVLAAIRAALSDGGRLLVFEPVHVPGEPLDQFGLADLFQLVFTGGEVRTLEGLGELLAEAGLRVTAVHPTAVFPIVEAVPC
jgi:SAM-dependent methyltransferase